MSKFVTLSLVALCAAWLGPVIANGADQREIKCEIGPVTKTFAKTEWQVFSCDDGRSLLAIAALKNPAAPFFFIIAPSGSGYSVHGDGTGDETVTDATYQELKKLSVSEISALIAQTKVK